jgi:glucosamine-6-phosphate deaminase
MFATVAKSYEEMSQKAALLVAAHILVKPDLVLGLPTGSTPIGMYRGLARMRREINLDFSGITTFNLDDYVGLPPSDRHSYRYFMQSNFFDHVNIRKHRRFLPDGMARDINTECERYERLIEERGPIDLFILGIGHNGHIGFNEPAGALQAKTHKEKLSARTRRENARFFDSPGEVPEFAITMGMGTIMKAREIILLAGSAGKAKALNRAVNGPVTPEVPASILQLHPNCRMIIDASAASDLLSEAKQERP